MKNTLFILATTLVLAGCQNNVETTGQATYARPASEGGEPVSKQNRGDFELTVSISGEAAWDVVEGVVCALTSGGAEGEVTASGSVRSDGSYSSAFATAEGSFSSSDDLLCGELQEVQFDSVLSFQVTGSIPANEENCEAFCQASAEAECEGSIDEVGCIAAAKASCDSDCAQSQKITGSAQISAEALAALNDDLSSSGKINASVDIVFNSLD